jgi:CRP-like cAMP-binding protein
MHVGELGKIHRDGEAIVRQGETGDCMYVVQEGQVEILADAPGGEIRLGVLGPGEIFGEMALFTRAPRSATVRALGDVRVLKVDKRAFLARVHEDPSLAFRILGKMADRIRNLDEEVIRLSPRGAKVDPGNG